MAFHLAGVMGWPVHHSLSPRLHGYWIRQYNLTGAYVPLAVAPEKVAEAVHALSALGFSGVNVTVPHKESVVPFMQALSPAAQRIGAVNLVVVRPDGSLFGDNTDGAGFLACLDEDAPGWDKAAQARPVVVLGAGGAARAIVDALQQRGVGTIRLLNRTEARAQALASCHRRDPSSGGHAGAHMEVRAWEDARALEDAALLVNTTSLGLAGQPPLTLNLQALPHGAVVFDAVYTPSPTPFLIQAAAQGARTVDGLGMLLHQAVPSFEAWFGVRPNVSPGLKAHVREGIPA